MGALNLQCQDQHWMEKQKYLTVLRRWDRRFCKNDHHWQRTRFLPDSISVWQNKYHPFHNFWSLRSWFYSSTGFIYGLSVLQNINAVTDLSSSDSSSSFSSSFVVPPDPAEFRRGSDKIRWTSCSYRVAMINEEFLMFSMKKFIWLLDRMQFLSPSDVLLSRPKQYVVGYF